MALELIRKLSSAVLPAASASMRLGRYERSGGLRPPLGVFLGFAAHCLLLLLFCGVLFFYGLTAGELYRTEGLRALVAAEMLHNGDWIVPALYGEPFLTKPPGMYAAIALVSWFAGGVTEWTARLPAALAATFTVFLMYWYFRRQLGPTGGLAAALLTPLSFLWLDKATAAEIDMLQVFWVTAAILCFLRALEITEAADHSPCHLATLSPCHYRPSLRPAPKTELWFWWLAALLCVAGGVLTKWTAPLFFYGTVVPLLWRRRRLRLLWSRYHCLGVFAAASVCLAWTGAVVSRVGWDPFYRTVSGEVWMRLLPSHHRQVYPWFETLTHPVHVWLAAVPMAVFALPALWPGFARCWDERERRLLQALHCWIWPNLLFWSLLPEHSVRHSFPILPGIAGLAALVWTAWWKGRLQSLAEPSAQARTGWSLATPVRALAAMLVCWLLVKLVFVHGVVPARTRGRDARVKGEQLAARVPEGKTLYLFRLKDDGILFYYGRPARRLADPTRLPSLHDSMYCILSDPEWRQWNPDFPAEEVWHARDQQGAPITLVRVHPFGQ